MFLDSKAVWRCLGFFFVCSCPCHFDISYAFSAQGHLLHQFLTNDVLHPCLTISCVYIFVIFMELQVGLWVIVHCGSVMLIWRGLTWLMSVCPVLCLETHLSPGCLGLPSEDGGHLPGMCPRPSSQVCTPRSISEEGGGRGHVMQPVLQSDAIVLVYCVWLT